ncbi:MAG: response regulator transcription factor [Proteobacteria bacterium]|nr:response regulator transcription factor [Pseudomonadota bacterium]MBU1685903.1 response regulator transcription factor [Pseudomonadota bacterium]
MAGTVEELVSLIRDPSLIWLHADCQPQEDLPKIITSFTTSPGVAGTIVMTSMPSSRKTALFLAGGASGSCHVLSTPELFRKVALVVRNGGLWVGSDLIEIMAGSLSRSMGAEHELPPPAILATLSDRELEVAQQVRSGASNKEIADVLGITERTVKAHLSSIFRKLEVRDRLQLILLLSRQSS